MKQIKKLLFVSFIFILGASLVNATYTTSNSSGYNEPIMDGSIIFKAELKDGKVYTSWTKYNKNEGFKYYKVIRSQTVSNPVYPDNGYIKYSSDLDFISYIDEKVPNGISYYRVCAITTEKNRYCSNVVKITKDFSKVCTLEYSPICGEKNGIKKTYSNKCVLEGEKANFLYKGECKKNIKPTIIGGDRDEHGCIGSAGYTWCKVKNKCIRPWEEKCEKKEEKIPKNCTSWYDGCNVCGIKDGKITYCTKRYCIRHDTPKCLKFKEEIKPIKVTEKLMKKADYLVERFIKKLEIKYKDNNTREKIIKIVIKKLESLKVKKPKAEYLIDYINKKLKEKILEYQNEIKEIENIFNQY